MISKRLAALAMSGLVLAGTATAVPLLVGDSTAGAYTGTHKAMNISGSGSLVEGKAKVKFSCSVITGTYSIVAKNLNVVSADGVSSVDGHTAGLQPMEVFVGTVDASGALTGSLSLVPITQDTSGLWGTTHSAALLNGGCASGNTFRFLMYGWTFQGTLS